MIAFNPNLFVTTNDGSHQFRFNVSAIEIVDTLYAALTPDVLSQPKSVQRAVVETSIRKCLICLDTNIRIENMNVEISTGNSFLTINTGKQEVVIQPSTVISLFITILHNMVDIHDSMVLPSQSSPPMARDFALHHISTHNEVVLYGVRNVQSSKRMHINHVQELIRQIYPME